MFDTGKVRKELDSLVNEIESSGIKKKDVRRLGDKIGSLSNKLDFGSNFSQTSLTGLLRRVISHKTEAERLLGQAKELLEQWERSSPSWIRGHNVDQEHRLVSLLESAFNKLKQFENLSIELAAALQLGAKKA